MIRKEKVGLKNNILAGEVGLMQGIPITVADLKQGIRITAVDLKQGMNTGSRCLSVDLKSGILPSLRSATNHLEGRHSLSDTLGYHEGQ